MACAAGMAQFTKCLSLDLTDTLSGDFKLLTDLFQGSGSAIIQTESQLDEIVAKFEEFQKDATPFFA